jgi:hypothetical protein
VKSGREEMDETKKEGKKRRRRRRDSPQKNQQHCPGVWYYWMDHAQRDNRAWAWALA